MTIAESWMEPLDPAQRRAAETPWGPVMILGGPGTGKTVTLLGRLATLIEQGANPDQIIFVAAGGLGTRTYFQHLIQLPEDVRHRLPHRVFTPLKLAAMVVLSSGAMARAWGLPSSRTMWSRESAFRMFEQAANPSSISRWFPPAEVGEMFRRCREMRAGVSQPGLDSRSGSAFGNVIDRFLERKQEAHCQDVDDLIPLAVGALQQADFWALPSDGHLVVDDLHDLTPAGCQMLGLIAGSTESFTVSADENLGAGSGAVDRFMADHPGSDIHRLALSYRHDDRVAHLVSGVSAHADTALATISFRGSAESQGSPAMILESGSDVAEIAGLVAGCVRQLLMDGFPWSDIVCIYGEPGAVGALQRELEQRGIPCVGPAGPDGPENPGVRRAMGLLAWVLNPADPMAFTAAVLTGYKPGDRIVINAVAKRVFEMVREEGADVGRAVEAVAANFAPDDILHQRLMSATAALREMTNAVEGNSGGLSELVVAALRCSGMDPGDDSDNEMRELLDTAMYWSEGGQDQDLAGDDLVEFLYEHHPDLEPSPSPAGDAVMITSAWDARNRYWPASIVILPTDPDGDTTTADRDTYLGISRATERAYCICVVDPEQPGSGRNLAILRDVQDRDRRQ